MIVSMLSGAILLICVFILSTSKRLRDNNAPFGIDLIDNPFNQKFPDCKAIGAKKLVKKTREKAILCPMFRDEEGFLSEWVAYYQMHGFDHITMFDDGSIDNGLVELKPWIDSGFVDIQTNWTVQSLNISGAFTRNEFKRAMTTKAVLEVYCKLAAIKWGYSMFVSLDIDEYMIPKKNDITIVDELFNWFNSTNRGVYCMTKLNFQQAPHTLEPVNLLTIEAYQTRMAIPAKMNYYTSVAAKCAYRLTSPDYRVNSSEYVAKCCHFHGCVGYDFLANDKTCATLHKSESWQLGGKGKPYYDWFDINHYSRSLEKFAIKGRTWRTSTGEVKAGENMVDVAKSYDIPKFLHRSNGWHHDNNALRFSCQLRHQLQVMTNETVYLRPGEFWYRNPEFGKPINDPDKRGRYGRHNPPGFFYGEKNPTHYFGGEEFDVKKKALTYGPNEWP